MARVTDALGRPRCRPVGARLLFRWVPGIRQYAHPRLFMKGCPLARPSCFFFFCCFSPILRPYRAARRLAKSGQTPLTAEIPLRYRLFFFFFFFSRSCTGGGLVGATYSFVNNCPPCLTTQRRLHDLVRCGRPTYAVQLPAQLLGRRRRGNRRFRHSQRLGREGDRQPGRRHGPGHKRPARVVAGSQ